MNGQLLSEIEPGFDLLANINLPTARPACTPHTSKWNGTGHGNVAFYHNRFGEFVIEKASGDIVLTDNRLPLVPDRIFNLGGSYAATEELGFTRGPEERHPSPRKVTPPTGPR